jgi:putative intracellular protease/amidase
MRNTQTVHLFVFDGLADWEASYAIAGINHPFIPEARRYAVRTVGIMSAPVRSMGGVTILPDLTLGRLDPAESALLILPGGNRWDAGELDEVLPHARHFLEAGVPVAAICGATAGLARAGLLDTAAHTSNERDYLAATGYQGENYYRETPAVTDGLLITAGATAALAFAAAIFAHLEVYPAEVIAGWYELFRQ